MKWLIVFVGIIFVSRVQGRNGLGFLENKRIFESVTVTSTNIVFQFAAPPVGLSVVQRETHERRKVSDYVERGENWILTPDQGEVRLSDGRHSFLIFIPVSYTNHHEGFGISKIAFWLGSVAMDVMYLALSDTPMQVSAEDLDEESVARMNDVLAPWRRFDALEETLKDEARLIQEQVTEEIPPAIAPTQSPPEIIEESTSLVEEELSEPSADDEATPLSSSRLWLYGALVFCALFSAVYFMRKRKNIS